jgi:hypothetical protein
MVDKNNKEKDIFIRIAWFDREKEIYDYGAWKDTSKDTSKEDVSSIVEWVKIQNKKYPRVKYWIEAMGGKNLGEIKNIEFYDLVSVEQNNGIGEWLSINHS